MIVEKFERNVILVRKFTHQNFSSWASCVWQTRYERVESIVEPVGDSSTSSDEIRSAAAGDFRAFNSNLYDGIRRDGGHPVDTELCILCLGGSYVVGFFHESTSCSLVDKNGEPSLPGVILCA